MTRPRSRAARPGAREDSAQKRLVRRYTDKVELRAIVAYAEARAIMLAWASLLRDDDPVILALRAVDVVFRARALRHPTAAAFGEEVRATLRRMTAAALYRAGRRLAASETLGDGQVGDVPGIETMFQAAGEAAVSERANDPRIDAASAVLSDYVRTAVIAAWNTRRQEDDP